MNSWANRMATSYLPTALLLIAVTLLAIWSLTSKIPQDVGVPAITVYRGIGLVCVGLVAGVLGGSSAQEAAA